MMLTVYPVVGMTADERITLSDLKTLHFDCQCLGRCVLNDKDNYQQKLKLYSVAALLGVMLV